MVRRTIAAFALLFFICGFNFTVKGDDDYAGLSFEFYNKTCPQLEKIVEDAISSASKEDPQTPAALLRLLYNDCAVMGCDASILLDVFERSKSEMGSFSNFGIKKRELIGQIKLTVEKICPNRVSCTDILVLAAREAVAVSQGPKIRVPLGRRDSSIAFSNILADQRLPPVDTFVRKSFGYLDNLNVGLTEEEKIALLSAHTLGKSHCATIETRIDYPGLIETNEAFVKKLKKLCPKGDPSNYNTSLPNDRTPYVFDDDIFIESLLGRGLLVTDVGLSNDAFTADRVPKFIRDEDYFFKVFASAFVKLSTSSVLTGSDGEIRGQCDKLNGK